MSKNIVRSRFASILIFLLLGSFAYLLIPNMQINAATVRDRKIFGIGEPLMSRSIWDKGNFSLESAFDAIEFLNVSRLRETTWMKLLLKDQTTVDSMNAQVLDSVVSHMNADNVTIMGMAQDFPTWMTGINASDNDSQIVPYRNITDGSHYMNFLQRYNESWMTLASRFSGITTWEIGNEYNADDFLHGYDKTSQTVSYFNDSMKINIIVDLLYYASSGVHHGNPNATTVLGGLAEGDNKTISVIRNTLESTYENIKTRANNSVTNSTNTDDYFQVACWHPYLFNVEPNITNWVDPNNDVRLVMENHNDTNKRVIFSEFGYRDIIDNTPWEVAKYLNETFKLAMQNFPWLDTIYWFRLVEPSNESISEETNPSGYGIINLNWTWKTAANSYQKLIESVPEYPTTTILTVFIATTLIAVVTYKRKMLKHLAARKRTEN